MLIIGAIATIYSFYVQAIPGELLDTPVLEIGWAFCTINIVDLLPSWQQMAHRRMNRNFFFGLKAVNW